MYPEPVGSPVQIGQRGPTECACINLQVGTLEVYREYNTYRHDSYYKHERDGVPLERKVVDRVGPALGQYLLPRDAKHGGQPREKPLVDVQGLVGAASPLN